jgi:hypothetical protein
MISKQKFTQVQCITLFIIRVLFSLHDSVQRSNKFLSSMWSIAFRRVPSISLDLDKSHGIKLIPDFPPIVSTYLACPGTGEGIWRTAYNWWHDVARRTLSHGSQVASDPEVISSALDWKVQCMSWIIDRVSHTALYAGLVLRVSRRRATWGSATNELGACSFLRKVSWVLR